MSDFSKMTIAQLKDYAKDNGIKLGDAKTKTEIVAKLSGLSANVSVWKETEEENVIGSKTIVTEKRVPVSNTRPNENGVMTVGSADTFKNKEFKAEDETPEGKIAVFSDKNMNWVGVGGIKKGYNIVTKEAAEKWLTRKGIREATPQEVASHYGL